MNYYGRESGGADGRTDGRTDGKMKVNRLCRAPNTTPEASGLCISYEK